MYSVVIPAYNEVGAIEATLGSVECQELRPGEVVVVDSGSTDNTAERVTEWGRRSSIPVRVLRGARMTPGAARNLGVRNSSLDWIAFLDAGAEAEAQWLVGLHRARLEHPDADVVFGSFRPRGDRPTQRAGILSYVPPCTWHDGWMRGPTSASLLVRRETFERLGGFQDLRAAEDLLFFDRLRQEGIGCAWAPEATVSWEVPATYRAVFRRFRVFSQANAAAGLEARWHYGVLRQYLVAAAIAGLARILRRRVLVAALPAGLLVRAARSIAVRREPSVPKDSIGIVVLIRAALMHLVTDAATFAGWAEAAVPRGSDGHKRTA